MTEAFYKAHTQKQGGWLLRLLLDLTVVVLGLVLGMALHDATDFLAFYTAGRLVASGDASNLYHLPAVIAVQESLGPALNGGRFPFWYAPLYAALLAPLSLLPLAAARLVWGLLGFAAARWALRIGREWSALGPRGSLLLLAFPPLWIALGLGQVSPLTLLLFTAIALLMWRNQGGMLAGVLAGLAIYKPQLLIPLLILWLVQWRWRELAGFAVTELGILAGSLMVSGEATRTYLFTVPAAMPAMQEELVARGVVVTPASLLSAFLPASIAAAIVAVVVMGVLLFAWRKPVTRYHHALLWLAVVLATPYLGHYDLLLLALPLSFLIPVLLKDRLVLGAVVALGAGFVLWQTHLGMAPTVLAATLLFGVCAWRALRARLHTTSAVLSGNPPLT